MISDVKFKTYIPLNNKNKLGRIYTTIEFKKHIDIFLKREYKYGVFLSDMKNEEIPIDCISHSIDNLYIKNDNLIIEITILNTTSGKNLRYLYENDIYFSLSPCSIGHIDNNYVSIEKLITFNIVSIEEDNFITIQKIRQFKLNKINKKYEK